MFITVDGQNEIFIQSSCTQYWCPYIIINLMQWEKPFACLSVWERLKTVNGLIHDYREIWDRGMHDGTGTGCLYFKGGPKLWVVSLSLSSDEQNNRVWAIKIQRQWMTTTTVYCIYSLKWPITCRLGRWTLLTHSRILPTGWSEISCWTQYFKNSDTQKSDIQSYTEAPATIHQGECDIQILSPWVSEQFLNGTSAVPCWKTLIEVNYWQ